MIRVLNFPLVLLLLSEAICLFLILINETLLRILGLSLESYAEKVLKSKEFLILLHSLTLSNLALSVPLSNLGGGAESA